MLKHFVSSIGVNYQHGTVTGTLTRSQNACDLLTSAGITFFHAIWNYNLECILCSNVNH